MQATDHRGTDKPNTRTIYFDAKAVGIKDADERRIEVPVSGLSTDRDGDEFTDAGIDHLIEQINGGDIPMFANHGLSEETGHHDYRFQDIMGKWVEATRQDGVVIAEGVLREGHDAGDELLDLLEQEMPVGFSIGFGWDEDDVEEINDGGLEFDLVDLMEISPVGIPSNPDAVVQTGMQLATAIKGAGIDPGTIDTDAIATAITNDMSDTNEGDESPDETEEQANKQVESPEEVIGLADEIWGAHHGAAVADFADALDIGDGDEEESISLDLDFHEFDSDETPSIDWETVTDEIEAWAEEADVETDDALEVVDQIREHLDGDTPEETEEPDESEASKELQEEMAGLKAELESLRVEMTESTGRRGIEPVDPEEADSETDDGDQGESPAEQFARNIV